LNLANTKLNGTVPVEIAQLVSLIVLNLADNDLSGEFPDISGLDRLTLLDLSSNDQLTDVPYLQESQGEQQVVEMGKSNRTPTVHLYCDYHGLPGHLPHIDLRAGRLQMLLPGYYRCT
jgi:hypothetical protein